MHIFVFCFIIKKKENKVSVLALEIYKKKQKPISK